MEERHSMATEAQKLLAEYRRGKAARAMWTCGAWTFSICFGNRV